MRYIELYENYGKRRMVLLQDKKILNDMADIFIELTDEGFYRNTFIGTIGNSKLKDHNTDTLYLCIVKPSIKWVNDLKERGYGYQLGESGNAYTDFFHTTYFDDTLQLFKQDEVKEYVLMFIDYMKGLWGEDIEVDLPNTYLIDKYFVRIKKRL